MKTPKKYIISFLVLSLMMMTPITYAADPSGKATSGVPAMPPIPLDNPLSGYKIAVPDAGTASLLKGGLEALGAKVDLIPLSSITSEMLSAYDVVWIACNGAGAVDAAGKSNEILDYIASGGGLILTQPNEVITPMCLPYTWQIDNAEWKGWPSFSSPKAAVIVDPNHPLTIGLSVDDMPDCFDSVGTVDSSWTILARAQNGDPSFACASFIQGKVIVEMDAVYPLADITGDNPCLSDAMVQRMIEWVSMKPIGGELLSQNIFATFTPYIFASVIALGALIAVVARKKGAL